MSNLTPAGYSRLDQETSKLAENDRERELSAYRPGDKNLMMWNTSGINRITQDRQSRSGQSTPPTVKKEAAVQSKKSIVTSKPKTTKKRARVLDSTEGDTPNLKKTKLGGN